MSTDPNIRPIPTQDFEQTPDQVARGWLTRAQSAVEQTPDLEPIARDLLFLCVDETPASLHAAVHEAIMTWRMWADAVMQTCAASHQIHTTAPRCDCLDASAQAAVLSHLIVLLADPDRPPLGAVA